MNNVQALNTITALANGVDPETGEVFSCDHPLTRPNTVRALFAASRALEVAVTTDQRRARRPKNTGKEWSEEDDKRLSTDYDQGMSLDQLAKAYERTRGSIQARLIRLGKIRL